MLKKQIIQKDGIYRCPDCGSKRITEVSQNVLIKMTNINTGRLIDHATGRGNMSNKRKAQEYDAACLDGVGCWFYECRKCGWKSEMIIE